MLLMIFISVSQLQAVIEDTKRKMNSDFLTWAKEAKHRVTATLLLCVNSCTAKMKVYFILKEYVFFQYTLSFLQNKSV